MLLLKQQQELDFTWAGPFFSAVVIAVSTVGIVTPSTCWDLTRHYANSILNIILINLQQNVQVRSIISPSKRYRQYGLRVNQTSSSPTAVDWQCGDWTSSLPGTQIHVHWCWASPSPLDHLSPLPFPPPSPLPKDGPLQASEWAP